MSTKVGKYAQFVAGLAFGVTGMFAIGIKDVTAQVQGSLPAYIKLQAISPGTPQSGHANVSGTIIAGAFSGYGSLLSNVNAQSIGGHPVATTISNTNDVLSWNGNTWSPSPLPGLTLPYSANGNYGNFVISLTNNSAFGTTVKGTGFHGLEGLSTAANGIGVYANGSTGVYALAQDKGVYGSGDSGVYDVGTTRGVYGDGGNYGVYGKGGQTGVYGIGSTYGVFAYTASTIGVGVNATGGTGVHGMATNIQGNGIEGYGGDGAMASGVRGFGGSFGYGVRGDGSVTGIGVYGFNSQSGYALYANGNSGGSGTKTFRIDHPLDPYNKYLLHYSSEGPEPLSIYSSNAVTEADGYAVIQLPSYFGEINKEPRYFLTVIGAQPTVMASVVRKIENNQFQIRTSQPKIEVSWRVEAVRNDRFVQRYGAPTEEVKPKGIQGTLQRPELYSN